MSVTWINLSLKTYLGDGVDYGLVWKESGYTEIILVSSGSCNKHYRPGGLNNRYLLLTFPGKSEVKVQASLVPGENSLSGLQISVFSLCPHKASWREREREPSGLSFFSHGDTSPITDPTLMTLSRPDHLSKAHLLPSIAGLRLQHRNFGGGHKYSH